MYPMQPLFGKRPITPFAPALLLAAALALLLAAPAPADPPAPALVPGGSHALSQFHRDDAAPPAVTRISLDASRLGRPLSPDVFGNFIENLWTVIYDSLWADALHDPALERVDPTDREPQWWDMTGAAQWQEAAGSGYLSAASVRLSVPDGRLSQRVFLPVYRVRGYALTFYARAPQGGGRLVVAVRAGGEGYGPFAPGMDQAGHVVVQTSVSVPGSGWQKLTVHWTLPAGSLAKGQSARLVLTQTGGTVDVDDVSLFPNDAVDRMDPDVLRLAQAWQIPVLRWSGNYSSGYHWREGIGPREMRPTIRNVAWGGPDSHQFGTDEFLDLARRLGATPQIGANVGSGTPEEAAAWVQYCNSPTLRVPLWEVGNELYGGWQIGHTDAKGYADRYVRFRDALLRADPRLRLIANGKADEFNPDGLARDRDWNLSALRAATSNGGQAPDYLSLHPLVSLPGDVGGFPATDRYESIMAHPAALDQTVLPEIERQITDVEGPNAHTRIAPTEWGLIISGDGWQASPNAFTESGAIYNALTLNAFLRHGDWVTLANVTSLLHGGSIHKVRGVPYQDPSCYTQQLYTLARPSLPVATDWTGPARDVPQRGFLPAARDVPDVDVFSALTSDRHALVAFLVNRRLADARPVRLDLKGFAPDVATATLLTSPDPLDGNGWDHPDRVRPRPFPLPPGAEKGALNLTLPPHSLVVLTLRRGH